MRYFVIAGEPSGDLYGALLIEQLKIQDKNANIMAIGGENMKAQNVAIILPISKLAVMGIWEIIKKVFFFKKAIKYTKKHIKRFQPDVLVLIDFPGFNLEIAKWAKQEKIKVVYYIPPKVWAWGAKRMEILRENVDKLLIILPFERDFYKEHNINFEYVGHPLIDVVARSEEKYFPITNKNIIAVMPGSRKQEIDRMLAVMLKVARFFPKYVFVIIKSSHLPDKIYEPVVARITKKNPYKNVILVRNLTDNILRRSRFALVKSGTATLEVCLYNIPQIVCYKTSWLTYLLAKKFLKVTYISLPNLIVGESIIPELIQYKMTEQAIRKRLEDLIYHKVEYQKIKTGYEKIHKSLHFSTKKLYGKEKFSPSLSASVKAAGYVVQLASKIG